MKKRFPYGEFDTCEVDAEEYKDEMLIKKYTKTDCFEFKTIVWNSSESAYFRILRKCFIKPGKVTCETVDNPFIKVRFSANNEMYKFLKKVEQ